MDVHNRKSPRQNGPRLSEACMRIRLTSKSQNLCAEVLDDLHRFERVPLQGQVLVERRSTRVTDLIPRPVNLAVLSRPCVALRLTARSRLPPLAGRRPPGLGRLCRHWLSLATRSGIELLRDGNQERLLRDNFGGFEALPASGCSSLKKDRN